METFPAGQTNYNYSFRSSVFPFCELLMLLIVPSLRQAALHPERHALQWNWRTRPDQFPFPELGPELWRDRLRQCVYVLAHLIARIGPGDD